jgi:triosephosphate isomerase
MALPKPLVVGNWKMFGTKDEAVARAGSLVARLDGSLRGTLALCPPFPHLFAVGEELGGSGILLGAQTCSAEDQGAHTGEVAGPMLADAGCRLVIVGHSERRHGLGESDADVHGEAEAALRNGLVPIVCVGETEAEYEAGRTGEILDRQLRGSLPARGEIVLAYEPVWAIGTGRTPSAAEIEAAHARIAALLAELGHAGAPVLYGGSVKPANATEIMATPGVDGVLVGGASLNSDDFWAIYQAGAGAA